MEHATTAARSCTGFKFSLRDMSQVCVKDMSKCVFRVTPFVQNSFAVNHTHAHIDKYDAARSVSWLPEVSSSTISPVCYHMGVPCALLKQAAHYLFQFPMMREEQQSQKQCFAPGVTWFACCRGKMSSNNNTDTRSDIRQRNSTLANLLAYANLVATWWCTATYTAPHHNTELKRILTSFLST